MLFRSLEKWPQIVDDIISPEKAVEIFKVKRLLQSPTGNIPEAVLKSLQISKSSQEDHIVNLLQSFKEHGLPMLASKTHSHL